MKIVEVLESIKNTKRWFDILRGTHPVAREIRQTYNKCIKGRYKNPTSKLYTRWWAEVLLENNKIAANQQLVEMLKEIIRICSS